MTTRQRGNGSIYKQAGCSTWSLQYYGPNGRRIRESTGTEDYTQAQQTLRQKLCAVDRGETPSLTRKVKVSELHELLTRHYRINRRKSLDLVEHRWKHLQSFFGEMLASQVTTNTIDRYVDLRLAAGAAPATVNRELAALKTAFHIAIRKATVARVPVFPVSLQEHNTRAGFVEDAGFRRLTEHASELWLRAFLELAYTYGWRKQELLNLKVRQIDLTSRLIRLDVGTTKNGEAREVAMTDCIFRLLEQAIAGKQPDDFLLTRPNGSRVKDFRTTWKRLCTKAGVERLLIHDFRRSAARNLRRAGVPESVVMNIGGWKTREMFLRYAIVNPGDTAAGIKKLEQARLAENSHDFSHDAPRSVQSEAGTKNANVN
jgi:integrase